MIHCLNHKSEGCEACLLQTNRAFLRTEQWDVRNINFVLCLQKLLKPGCQGAERSSYISSSSEYFAQLWSAIPEPVRCTKAFILPNNSS